MRVLIFDTETIGKVTQDLLNVGYKIVDIDIQNGVVKETFCERDYLVSDLYANEIYCINDDFVGRDKYAKYQELVANKEITKHKLPKIMDLMTKDIEKFEPLFVYAYNCQFDVDKFNKSCLKYNCYNPLTKMQVFDIWAYASQFIFKTEDYQAWGKANDIITDSGVYLSTSVESCIKYLTQNLEFVEDHTALSDVQWETFILVECVRRGADITRPVKLDRFIKSGKVFTTTIVVNGVAQVVEYTKKCERNGKITYTNESVKGDL